MCSCTWIGICNVWQGHLFWMATCAVYQILYLIVDICLNLTNFYGLPTVGVGQTHPKPEKRAVRILLECFLVRMNIIIKVYLHWTKQKLTRKRIVFFDLCCYSMWTLHWILYEPILTRFAPLCNPQFETHLTTSWKYLNCWITSLLQKDTVTWFCNEQIPTNLSYPTTR